MNSLRNRIWLGFGSLLAILLVVSSLTIIVFTRYSHALERVFHENYDSAVFCDAMKDSLDQLNTRAQRLIWEEPAARRIDTSALEHAFATNLRSEQGNCTLPGEMELTEHIAQLWSVYLSNYGQFDGLAAAGRSDFYKKNLLPEFEELKRTAQSIANMNMSNMVSVDGQAKQTLVAVRNALLILVIAGSALAGLVVWTVGVNIRHGQDRLIRTQQTTQLAIDSLPDAVFVINPDDTIEIANEAARRYFNIQPGRALADLSLPWLAPLYEQVKQTRAAAESRGYQSAIQLFVDGQERFLLPRAVPMLSPDGRQVGVTAIIVDVTQPRQVDEAKSGLLSHVSHELRTPLTSQRLLLGLLVTSAAEALTPSQRRMLEVAKSDSDRLYRTIDEILSLSRIESGRAQFQFRAMSPREIVLGAVDPLREMFADKKVELIVKAEADLPMVRADSQSINSALTNLLSNALKFTPSGGHVRVAAGLAADDYVAFSVTDTGPGIPAEFRPRIFEKFFRVPVSSGLPGAGLGLTIAKNLVEAHGGTIAFSCPAAGGTVFRFTIPCHAIAADAPRTAGRTSPSVQCSPAER